MNAPDEMWEHIREDETRRIVTKINDRIWADAMEKAGITTRSEMTNLSTSICAKAYPGPYNGADYIDGQNASQFYAQGETPMAILTGVLSLYEVYIVDRRFTDAAPGGVVVDHARATSAEEAKLKVILRNGYAEHELKFLDLGVHRRTDFVQPIDDDAVGADDDDAE